MNNGNICIVKVGSAVVTNAQGALDTKFLFSICRQLDAVKNAGWKPVLISSGAKITGKDVLNKHRSTISLDKQFTNERRLLAGIGQAQLIMTYSRYFDRLKSSLIPAQILLTRQSLADRSRYLEIKRAINEMLDNGVVPIVNNNDVTYARQIDFSDNDQIATYLAGMLNADAVVFVSDSGGVYNKNPLIHADATRIAKLEGDDWPEIEVNDKGSSFGGMKGKLEALRVLANLGICARVVSKADKDVILRSVTKPKSRFGTKLVVPSVSMQRGSKGGLKRWLATGAFPVGMVIVSDPGAKALASKIDGRSLSLLGVGVVAYYGVFAKGDIVAILDEDYDILAIGQIRFGSAELLNSIKGPSSQIVIHADKLLPASEAAFLGINLQQWIRSDVERLKSNGYKIAESRRGSPRDNKGGVVRISNRNEKGVDEVNGDSDVVWRDEMARDVVNEARLVARKLSVNIPDWLLFKAFYQENNIHRMGISGVSKDSTYIDLSSRA